MSETRSGILTDWLRKRAAHLRDSSDLIEAERDESVHAVEWHADAALHDEAATEIERLTVDLEEERRRFGNLLAGMEAVGQAERDAAAEIAHLTRDLCGWCRRYVATVRGAGYWRRRVVRYRLDRQSVRGEWVIEKRRGNFPPPENFSAGLTEGADGR